MGCGCGRTRAPLKIGKDESVAGNTQQPTPLAAADMQPIVTLEPLPNQPLNPVLEVTNTGALGAIASGTTRLSGVPMLKKRQSSTLGNGVVVAADSTAVPVAKPRGSYNLMSVLKDTLKGEVEYASSEKAVERQAVCNGCPHQVAGACTKCGCIIKLKVKYEESSCPIGKW